MDGCLWMILPGMQFFLFFLFFFLSFFPGPEHNGKPFVLYCSVVELDRKIHHGLGSIPPAFPSLIFASSQCRRRSPLCGSTLGNGSITCWWDLARQHPMLGVRQGRGWTAPKSSQCAETGPVGGRPRNTITSIL